MPIHFSIRGSLIDVRFTGVVTGEDLIAAAADFASLELSTEPTLPRLVDLNLPTALDLDFDSIQRFMEMRGAVRLKNRVRSAIVASMPVNFGLARMYETLSEHPDILIEVFKDREQAERWVVLPL